MRRISIFGATGSIGQNTLDLIRRDRTAFQVVALTGGHNIAQLARDAIDTNAKIAVTAFESQYQALKDALAGTGIEVAAGQAAIVEAADRPADWTMSAIVGAAGLEPGLRSLRHGGTLALANKESLVCAGPLVLSEAQRHSARLLPVDSEHSAMFQALVGEDIDTVERIIVTASGGPFRDWPLDKLSTVTPEQAAVHPNWEMGQRITIDSASMFNKAMEVIETKEYFGVDPDVIEVLVHPESLVHALVGYKDGALMAHVGPHDMRHAIGYALYEATRKDLPVERLDLAKIGQLTFEPADEARWPALRLAREVLASDGLSGTVFNAAKERALDGFIAKELGFTQMAEVVEKVLDDMSVEIRHSSAQITPDMVRETDQQARAATARTIAAL